MIKKLNFNIYITITLFSSINLYCLKSQFNILLIIVTLQLLDNNLIDEEIYLYILYVFEELLYDY